MEEVNKNASENANDDSVNTSPSDQQSLDANNQDTGAQSNAPDKKNDGQVNYEFKGDWQELEEKAPEAYNWALGVRRYLTKESEQISRDKDKIDKYTKLENDPELGEFLDWKKARKTGQIPATQQSAYYTENQVNLDSSGAYVDPEVARLKAELAEKERLFSQQFNQLNSRVTKIDKANALEAFAQAHPDFYELHRLGLLAPQLQKIEQTGKGTIADAYNAAVDEKQRIVAQLRKEQQTVLKHKQSASSATPTSSGEPDTEYIDAKGNDDIIRRAFELAQKGQTKSVRRRKK